MRLVAGILDDEPDRLVGTIIVNIPDFWEVEITEFSLEEDWVVVIDPECAVGQVPKESGAIIFKLNRELFSGCRFSRRYWVERHCLIKRIIATVYVVRIWTRSRGWWLRTIGVLVEYSSFYFLTAIGGTARRRSEGTHPHRICGLSGRLNQNVRSLTHGEGNNIGLVRYDRHEIVGEDSECVAVDRELLNRRGGCIDQTEAVRLAGSEIERCHWHWPVACLPID